MSTQWVHCTAMQLGRIVDKGALKRVSQLFAIEPFFWLALWSLLNKFISMASTALLQTLSKRLGKWIVIQGVPNNICRPLKISHEFVYLKRYQSFSKFLPKNHISIFHIDLEILWVWALESFSEVNSLEKWHSFLGLKVQKLMYHFYWANFDQNNLVMLYVGIRLQIRG